MLCGEADNRSGEHNTRPDVNRGAAESEQIRLMKRLVELSAERTYMNAERTLSVWVRTALD